MSPPVRDLLSSSGDPGQASVKPDTLVVYTLSRAREGLTLVRLQLILFLVEFELARKGRPGLGLSWKLASGLPSCEELRDITEELSDSGILSRAGRDASILLASPAFRGRKLMLPKHVRKAVDRLVSSFEDPGKTSKLLNKVREILPEAMRLGIVTPPAIKG